MAATLEPSGLGHLNHLSRIEVIFPPETSLRKEPNTFVYPAQSYKIRKKILELQKWNELFQQKFFKMLKKLIIFSEFTSNIGIISNFSKIKKTYYSGTIYIYFI